jgi:hypothetical protein
MKQSDWRTWHPPCESKESSRRTFFTRGPFVWFASPSSAFTCSGAGGRLFLSFSELPFSACSGGHSPLWSIRLAWGFIYTVSLIWALARGCCTATADDCECALLMRDDISLEGKGWAWSSRRGFWPRLQSARRAWLGPVGVEIPAERCRLLHTLVLA